MDASFGGEEWLCVNYLYGPSAVLKRPRESRASMLLYLKEMPMMPVVHNMFPHVAVLLSAMLETRASKF